MRNLPPRSETEEVDDETLVLRGMSVVQNLLHQKRRPTTPKNEAVIVGLLEEGSKRGLNIKKLAISSRLSVSLIRKLDLRQILFASIPKQAIQYIAQVLQCSQLAVANYLQQPPKLAKQVHYRAMSRPTPNQQQEDFFEAVKQDLNLDEEDRRYWLALKPHQS